MPSKYELADEVNPRPYLCIEPLAEFVCCRDVAELDNRLPRFPVGSMREGSADPSPHDRPIPAEVALLDVDGVGRAGQHVVDEPPAQLPILGSGHIFPCHREQLVVRVPEKALKRLVGVEEPASRHGQRHARRRAVECPSEALLSILPGVDILDDASETHRSPFHITYKSRVDPRPERRTVQSSQQCLEADDLWVPEPEDEETKAITYLGSRWHGEMP